MLDLFNDIPDLPGFTPPPTPSEAVAEELAADAALAAATARGGEPFGVMLSAFGDPAGPGGIALRYDRVLEALDRFEHPRAPRNEEEYETASRIKSMLCGLSCYTSNTAHPLNDRVWALESRWGKALAAYNRRFLITDTDTRTLARYLLWNKRVTRIRDHGVLYEEAARRGILRRAEPGHEDAGREGAVVVVGLAMKVGDNVFTVDRRGGQHRNYVRTTGRQAFVLSQRWADERPWLAPAGPFAASLPALDPEARITYVGDSKYAARTPSLTQAELRRIVALADRLERDRALVAARTASYFTTPVVEVEGLRPVALVIDAATGEVVQASRPDRWAAGGPRRLRVAAEEIAAARAAAAGLGLFDAIAALRAGGAWPEALEAEGYRLARFTAAPPDWQYADAAADAATTADA